MKQQRNETTKGGEGGQQKVLKAGKEVKKRQDANVGNNVMNKAMMQ